MDMLREVLVLLDSTLNLNGRGRAFTRDTALLGAVPELDSMGVVALITAMEDRLGVTVEDDEIDGSTFATVGACGMRQSSFDLFLLYGIDLLGVGMLCFAFPTGQAVAGMVLGLVAEAQKRNAVAIGEGSWSIFPT